MDGRTPMVQHSSMREGALPMLEHELDDRRAFVAAACQTSRLDESIGRTPAAVKVYVPGAMRREAAAAAAMEGLLVREEFLARLLGDRDMTNAARGARLAADVYDALALVSAWPQRGPSQSDCVSAFMAADSSSGRLLRPDVQWSIEEDAAWLSNEVASFSETPEPWTAIETIRTVWTSGRFFGTARRMSMIAATWLLPRGFGCERTLFGLAGQASKDPEGLRDAAQDSERWAVRVAAAAAAAFSAERSMLADSLAMKASMLALCPPGRSSSSVEAVIDFCFTNPVFTSKLLSSRLGLSPGGAKLVLDRLVDNGVLTVDSGSRNRKYVCRRMM